jgi:hypothetical protein
MATTIKIPAMKRSVVQIRPGTKIDPILDAIRNRFRQLGCPTCFSGINRMVLFDKTGKIR